MVLIKIVQVIKNNFSETGFVINNKPQFKKENSYAWLDYVVLKFFYRSTFWLLEEYI